MILYTDVINICNWNLTITIITKGHGFTDFDFTPLSLASGSEKNVTIGIQYSVCMVLPLFYLWLWWDLAQIIVTEGEKSKFNAFSLLF